MLSLPSAAPLPRADRLRRLACLLLFLCAFGLFAAQHAAADTSAYIPSATPLGFPTDAAAFGGNWWLAGTTCGSGDACLAVGSYEDSSNHNQAYVVPIVDGVPGAAAKVQLPANAATNPNAELEGVTCMASNICEAYGFYYSSGLVTPMVVQITNGVPAPAVAVPLPTGVKASNYFYVQGLSCYSAGTCVAVGDYANSANDLLPFVLPIIDGAPQSADTPAMPADADTTTPNDSLDAVACQPSGVCVAVGAYTDLNSDSEAVVVPITDGVAGTGVATAPADGNGNPDTSLGEVACPASGTCEAVGLYETTADVIENMVVPIVNGAPGTATGLAVAGTQNSDEAYMSPSGLSCSSSSMCVAAGSYIDSSDDGQAAVMPITSAGATVVEASLPAGATANPLAAFYSGASGSSVGCVPSGPCLASGYYSTATSSAATSGMVEQISADGVVGTDLAATAPSDIDSNGPNSAGPYSLLNFGAGCVVSGSCVATGEYFAQSQHTLPYVLSEQAPLTISPSSVAGATQGSAYQATLSAAGAWGSYSWSVSSGSLPAGLSLNSQTGVISGTPTGSGSSSFTAEATGTGSPVQTATETLSLAVSKAASTTSTTSTTPSTPRVSVLSTSTKVSANKLGVKLSCSGASCGGTVKVQLSELVTVKRGKKRVHEHRTVVIGSGGYRVAAGASKTLDLTLKGTGKRALSAAKGHRLAVTIVATVTGGQQATRRETIVAAVKRKKR
jgi:hypothetical protein